MNSVLCGHSGVCWGIELKFSEEATFMVRFPQTDWNFTVVEGGVPQIESQNYSGRSLVPSTAIYCQPLHLTSGLCDY